MDICMMRNNKWLLFDTPAQPDRLICLLQTTGKYQPDYLQTRPASRI